MIADIKQIDGWESLTAEQIATALRQTGLTQRPIELGDLLFLLNNRGMLVRLIRPADGGEKWAGTLVNLINHCNDTGHPLALHVNQFFSHITNDRNKTFDTTQRQYAGLFLLIVSTFAGQANMPTLEDFAAVASLGGGWLYGNVTAEEVTAAIEANAIEKEKQSLEPDATGHEVLLSVNRSHDGTIRAMGRVTPVEMLNGQVLRRGESRVITGEALTASVRELVEGLIDG